MSALMWVVAALVAVAGALQWAQGATALGVLLMLASIGLAPLGDTRTFRRGVG
ncbi:MAG: hypothetical protein ACT4P1_16595 [Sporichthyaceae bacterium]